MNTDTNEVVHLLSDQILAVARSVAAEQHCPGGNADHSDEKIKQGQEKLRALRDLRERYEVIMTGVIV